VCVCARNNVCICLCVYAYIIVHTLVCVHVQVQKLVACLLRTNCIAPTVLLRTVTFAPAVLREGEGKKEGEVRLSH
jgi:hypothetical protein